VQFDARAQDKIIIEKYLAVHLKGCFILPNI
jgi:hypothetical protein